MIIIFILLGWLLVSLIGAYSDTEYADDLLDKQFRVKHIVFMPWSILLFIIVVAYYTVDMISNSKFIAAIGNFLNKKV